jgi:hypothetical protein
MLPSSARNRQPLRLQAGPGAVPIIRLLRTNFYPAVAWGFAYTHMQGGEIWEIGAKHRN